MWTLPLVTTQVECADVPHPLQLTALFNEEGLRRGLFIAAGVQHEGPCATSARTGDVYLCDDPRGWCR